MASIAKTAFEVSVSNITRNSVQNVPGYFGAVADSVFTGDICPAGFLVVRNALVKSEGYEAQNIKNGNTWAMVTATNGSAAIGRPGDRTGIFAFNTYDVRQVDDGLNLWKLGANFLGLELPAGIRGDFTEIIIGEQYTFGEGNFSTPPANASAIYATISNGLLVASSSAPADGSGLYFEILRSKRFTEGGRDAGFVGYVCEAKRAAIAIPAELPAVTNVDAGKALMVNSSGQWAADNLPKELPAATAANAGEVLGVDSSGNYVLQQPGGGALMVNSSRDEETGVVTLDKTYAEIRAAMPTMPVICFIDGEGEYFCSYCMGAWHDELQNLYIVGFYLASTGNIQDDLMEYTSETEDGPLTRS